MIYKHREPVKVEDLNQMQRYLGEETIDEYRDGHMSRRRMLRRLVLICGSSAAASALLAACGDATATQAPATTAAASQATTSAATTAASTTAPAATTAAPTTAAATSAATTTAATTAAATTSAATTVAATTSAATAAAGTTAASGATAAGATTAARTTAAGGTAPAQQAPGQARGPLVVPANDPAVEGSDVSYQSDTPMFGYLARPKAAGTYPGVIVIHENRGLTDHIKDVARRLAKAGYIALAVDLASRAGGTAKLPTDQISGFLANARADDLVKDLNSSVDFLEKQNGLKAGKLGVVGFCYGGGMTLRLAANNQKIVAAVPYYGSAPQPVSQMTNTKAAILGQYGGNDTRVNAGIPDLEKTLKDAGKTFEKKIWDGAGHAFNNDTGANFNENAAVNAWKDTLAWFDKHLKA